MKSSLLLLCFLMLVFSSCSEDSASPTVDGIYKFGYTFEETAKVYGEGGAEIPQNDWNEECLIEMNYYKDRIDFLKKLQIKIESDKLYLIKDTVYKTYNLTMNGDTLVVSNEFNGEAYIYSIARKINNNTLEFHFYTFRSEIGGIETNSSDDEINKLDNEKAKYLSYISNLEKHDWVGLFSFKVHFKK